MCVEWVCGVCWGGVGGWGVQIPKYDAHIVYVTAPPSVPCNPDRWEVATVYSELVVFENAAILPRFILSLDVA